MMTSAQMRGLAVGLVLGIVWMWLGFGAALLTVALGLVGWLVGTALESATRRWPAAVRSLITGRYPLDAYRDLFLGQPGGIKNVLSFEAARMPAAGPAKASARV